MSNASQQARPRWRGSLATSGSGLLARRAHRQTAMRSSGVWTGRRKKVYLFCFLSFLFEIDHDLPRQARDKRNGKLNKWGAARGVCCSYRAHRCGTRPGTVFLAPHCTEDNHFTKTGSGQTWENLSEKAFSGRRCLIRRTNRSFSTANCGTHSQTTGIEMSEKRRSSLSMINTIICQGRLGTHVTERWKIKRITVSRCSNKQANCGSVLLRNASHRLR